MITICLLIGVALLVGCWGAAVVLLPSSSGRHTGGQP